MIFHGECVAQVMLGDCLQSLRTLPAAFVSCGITSPPYYGLRDYGVDGQIGLEETPECYIARLVEVFREFRRVLRDDGTLWLNIGDSYARNPSKGGSGPNGKNAAYSDTYTEAGKVRQFRPGSSDGAVRRGQGILFRASSEGIKEKDLIGIPWMLAFALRADGWFLRQDIIWHKPNAMPESVLDRCTKAHEYLFLLSKSQKYYFNSDALREPAVKGAAGSSFNSGKTAEHQLGRSSQKDRAEDRMRNRRSVWNIPTRPFKGAHFATFPPSLIEPCLLAGSRPGDVVMDPFGGSSATAGVALKHGRHALLCELNAEYAALVPDRIKSIVSGS